MRMLITALLLAIAIFVLVFFGIQALFTAYPLSEQMQTYIPLMAATFSFIASVTSTIIVIWKMQRELSTDSPQLNVKVPVAEPPKGYDLDKQRLRAVAQLMYERKEQYKTAAQRQTFAAAHFRLRLFVWRTALAFAAIQFLSGLAASTYLGIRYPAGIPQGVTLPWGLQYLHSLLLTVSALVVPGMMYTFYLRHSLAIPSRRVASQIGGGGIFLGSALFFLGLTPESISFLAGAARIPVLPFGVAPTVSGPFLVFLFTQKLVLLPLLGMLGGLFARGLQPGRTMSSKPSHGVPASRRRPATAS